MNVFVIQDPENGNYLGRRHRWTSAMYKAELFTHVSSANKERANLKKRNTGKKYIVKEFELVHRCDR